MLWSVSVGFRECFRLVPQLAPRDSVLCVCAGSFAGPSCEHSCGVHGTSNGTQPHCHCRDHYVGTFCDSPLPPGFAPSYNITGCTTSAHCGVFTRTSFECDNVSAYWRAPQPQPQPPRGQLTHGGGGGGQLSGLAVEGASLYRYSYQGARTGRQGARGG